MTKPPKFIYNPIWKITGIILFLYVIIGGLSTPLNPGLTMISPDQAKAGSTATITCKGYNTNFQKSNKNYAWLKLDSTHLLPAKITSASSDNILEATFDIPVNIPVETKNAFATVITYNEIDGAALRPSGLYITDLVQGEDPQWQVDFGMKLSPPVGIRFPFRSILDETIRNTFFHVALWLAMIILLLIGLYHAVMYLINKDLYHDRVSSSFNRIAILYGILGLITGSIWAKHTWGTWWTTDIKLNMSAIAMLIYMAYLVLRSSTLDFEKRARLSAVYSIFSFAVLIPLIFIIPRLTDSLHPGNGGNPALGGEDLDNTLRMFFYPSIIALILIGSWIATLLYRSDTIEDKIMQEDL